MNYIVLSHIFDGDCVTCILAQNYACAILMFFASLSKQSLDFGFEILGLPASCLSDYDDHELCSKALIGGLV